MLDTRIGISDGTSNRGQVCGGLSTGRSRRFVLRKTSRRAHNSAEGVQFAREKSTLLLVLGACRSNDEGSIGRHGLVSIGAVRVTSPSSRPQLWCCYTSSL